jgi:hypothetical protein
MDYYLFRESADDLVGNRLKDAHTFLEYTITTAFPAIQPFFHFFQRDILEAKYLSSVVIGNEYSVHVTNPRLEAIKNSIQLDVVRWDVAIPVFEKSRTNEIVIFPLKALEATVEATD